MQEILRKFLVNTKFLHQFLNHNEPTSPPGIPDPRPWLEKSATKFLAGIINEQVLELSKTVKINGNPIVEVNLGLTGPKVLHCVTGDAGKCAEDVGEIVKKQVTGNRQPRIDYINTETGSV
jgi:hypothetical protein